MLRLSVTLPLCHSVTLSLFPSFPFSLGPSIRSPTSRFIMKKPPGRPNSHP